MPWAQCSLCSAQAAAQVLHASAHTAACLAASSDLLAARVSMARVSASISWTRLLQFAIEVFPLASSVAQWATQSSPVRMQLVVLSTTSEKASLAAAAGAARVSLAARREAPAMTVPAVVRNSRRFDMDRSCSGDPRLSRWHTWQRGGQKVTAHVDGRNRAANESDPRHRRVLARARPEGRPRLEV